MEFQTSLKFEAGFCNDSFCGFLKEKKLVCINKQIIECYYCIFSSNISPNNDLQHQIQNHTFAGVTQTLKIVNIKNDACSVTAY